MSYSDLIRAINDSPFKLVLAYTGGGQSFPYHFMKLGGASKTIVDLQCPYAPEALDAFCGKHIEKSVSESTARLMATRAYSVCCNSVQEEYAVGIGMSCSLATDNERVGRVHKFVLAVHCYNFTAVKYLELSQGLTREQEEQICCDLIFRAISNVVGLIPTKAQVKFDEFLLANTGRQEFRHADFEFASNIHMLALMPGSYNPFHEGHLEMWEIATEILGIRPILEITTCNADKGLLDHIDIADRVKTIDNNLSVIMTSARTFLDKAIQYADPTKRQLVFVVGSDTWNRILDPKYAGDMPGLYAKFDKLNVRFLVLNRDGYPKQWDPFLDMLVIEDERCDTFCNSTSSTQKRGEL